ncbi:MAG: CDP-alcohol phosphatidyltransferase family protein [Phycisphaerae bacterium]|jgi:CDP-diacylglycerol--glycerol-3-phosphate 3-phosphatidyltransferase|nr:CDP-alcohol phosphatidyltransferase family protein [Phycisphaerae bacterium]HPC22548.1 CDP-alcohol phosphatidyltransferase family protein [Phycisphaerae bacterium]HRS28253.1 CDP-alcohol phosphatidyltransferase family protein [Phycisphaerae bacterium]HRT41662.1 CDP-alcohol phosphatidyltransferase family protein [Phycisphaerae bacterium]
MRINLPNQITLGRLLLAAIFFVLLSLFNASDADNLRWLIVVSFWIFVVAAISDILDGFLARWLKQETPFGRVVDPIVDKVMICGAFVFFASPKFYVPGVDGAPGDYITDVKPWMAVVILSRELAVSGIRAHAEAGGEKFAALWAGKLKMFVQSVTALVILAEIGWNLKGVRPVSTALVWLTVIITVLSIISYLRRAHSFLLSSAALGATSATPPKVETPPSQPELPSSTNRSPGAAV